MTELLLNLLWLSIALGATAVWRLSWARDRVAAPRDSFREWTAFACALVFLFFAVSLTDDLHQDVFLSDECSIARRHGSSAVHAVDSGGTATPVWSAPPAALPEHVRYAPVRVVGRIVEESRSSALPLAIRVRCTRAPPLSSL